MAGSYRQVVKAKSVSARYNEPPKSYMSWNNDVCLDVVIEKQSKDGSSYDYTFTISGNYKKTTLRILGVVHSKLLSSLKL